MVATILLQVFIGAVAMEVIAMLSNFPIGLRIAVSDLERARAFYVGTLGLEPRAESTGHAVSFKPGDGSIFAIYSEGDFARPRGIWIVDDVEAEVHALQARGVVFNEYDTPDYKSSNGVTYHTKSELRFAYFDDPEGNQLGIFPARGH
jgi:catechol 2,3-dioxygenase-like lactoylglutathione lyase family enzyme